LRYTEAFLLFTPQLSQHVRATFTLACSSKTRPFSENRWPGVRGSYFSPQRARSNHCASLPTRPGNRLCFVQLSANALDSNHRLLGNRFLQFANPT
jgi:hypothetical protein